ncbi:MAG: hypothetical protein EXS25_01565 [Pedosphaera sp.]|nr:hypothetical protein [Pedosphaera sp.]
MLQGLCLLLWVALSIKTAPCFAAVHLSLVHTLEGFKQTENPKVWVSSELIPPTPFQELILSWNIEPSFPCRLEVRVLDQNGWGRWWQVAQWSSDTNSAPRTSLGGQKDAEGQWDTDTLIRTTEGIASMIRLTFSRPDVTPSDVPLLGISTWSSAVKLPIKSQVQDAAQSRVIDVPKRSQADYSEGITRWCSPTSTAMVMAYWARELGCLELDLDVRTVAAGVTDPAWEGTGNWCFNTAFAGSRPELRTCVARLGGLIDLKALISAGLPCVVSVSYGLMKGGPKALASDGHLVVVCGLTATSVIINDPGVQMSRVRREVPLGDFEKAWQASKQTAYLFWSTKKPLPTSPVSTW